MMIHRSFFLFALITIFVCSPEEPRAEEAPVTIGAILSLTGDVAAFGTAIQQGMEIALAEGSAGDFRIVYEDDRSVNRVAAVSAAKKLVDVDHVPVVLNMVATTASSIAPVLKSGNAVGIIVWDSNEELAKLDSIVGMGYGTESAAEEIATYAVRRLGLKRIAVIAALDDWAAVYSSAFKRKVTELGAEVVLAEGVNPTESDFRSLMARIRGMDADGVMGVLYTGALVSWLKQSPLQGYKGVLMTADAISSVEIQAAGAAAEGVYASQIWVENDALERAFAAKYGKAPDRVNVGFLSLGYDTVRCLSKLKGELASRELGFDAETVREALPGFSCSGTGGSFKISQERLSDKKEQIVVVRGGRLELADQKR